MADTVVTYEEQQELRKQVAKFLTIDGKEQIRRQDRLTPKARYAFTSISGQLRAKGRLTNKQWAYFADLCKTVLVETESQTMLTVTDMPVLQLHGFLERSPGTVKFLAPHGAVKIKYAGIEYTSYPMHYHVMALNNLAPGSEEVYIGRITPTGICVFSVKATDEHKQALAEINADPVKHAVMYSQATNICCFCGRELTDEPSVAAGYGPVCADNYGLPWGDGKVEEHTDVSHLLADDSDTDTTDY